MAQDRGSGRRRDEEPPENPTWEVDVDASLARARDAPARHGDGGKLIFTDEQGRRRRLPANMDELSREEVAAATRAMSAALGAPPPDYARKLALERLSELHASGAMSEEDYIREKRRLLGY